MPLCYATYKRHEFWRVLFENQDRSEQWLLYWPQNQKLGHMFEILIPGCSWQGDCLIFSGFSVFSLYENDNSDHMPLKSISHTEFSSTNMAKNWLMLKHYQQYELCLIQIQSLLLIAFKKLTVLKFFITFHWLKSCCIRN